MSGCLVCGARDSRPVYSGILRCAGCGFTYADVDMTDAELSELYSKNYFFGDEYSDYLADRNVIEKNFKLRLRVLEGFLHDENEKRLLEIGCAYGFFLNLVKDKFKDVRGIDISKDGTDYARDKLRLDVVNGDFLKHDFGNGSFDAVCMWDTIEHIRSPDLYLEKISRLTKKGAILAITTGDIESLNSRIRKGRWRLLHPPTHLHYFSEKTMKLILNRYGFEVLYSRHCGFYRSVDNIAYNIFVLRKKNQTLYNLLKRIGLTDINIYLNLYDIMYVIAVRR